MGRAKGTGAALLSEMRVKEAVKLRGLGNVDLDIYELALKTKTIQRANLFLESKFSFKTRGYFYGTEHCSANAKRIAPLSGYEVYEETAEAVALMASLKKPIKIEKLDFSQANLLLLEEVENIIPKENKSHLKTVQNLIENYEDKENLDELTDLAKYYYLDKESGKIRPIVLQNTFNLIIPSDAATDQEILAKLYVILGLRLRKFGQSQVMVTAEEAFNSTLLSSLRLCLKENGYYG